MQVDAPLRIRWDLDPPEVSGKGGPHIDDLRSTLSAIEGVSPFSLDMTVESEDGLIRILQLLAEGGRDMSRTIFLGGRLPYHIYPQEYFQKLDVKAVAHASTLGEVDWDSYWLAPLPDNYEDIGRTLSVFFSAGGEELIVKNPNLRKTPLKAGGISKVPEGLAPPSPSREREGRGRKKLVIHDFFLWAYLKERLPAHVDGRAEFGGCQGGSMVAYIDWEGIVYPCESLLYPLGSLKEKTLSEIWRGRERENLSETIKSLPPDCRECEELEGCLGGCRGLAFHLDNSFDRPDPQCDR